MTDSNETGEINPHISVVVPMYNEEGNIQPLLARLMPVVLALKYTFEIILVDDGSQDNTWPEIEQASSAQEGVEGLRLVRNFGHQHALLAGLAHSRGELTISMDGDLQHPPELIPDLIAEHQRGYLVVNTKRNDIQVTSFFKRKSSSIFYKVFAFLTDVPMSEGLSDFRLMDRRVLNQLLKFKDVDIFLRGAVEWLGYSSSTLSYDVGVRHSGRSKYTLSKMLNFASGSIISFSSKPLKISIWIGIWTSIAALIYLIYIISQVFLGETVKGWASTVGIISFLFGILFIILGVIGTYLSRIHMSLQERPKYLIEESTGSK